MARPAQTWTMIWEMLDRELAYHHWYYDLATESFVLYELQEFMETRPNKYLSEMIPQDLYEYGVARTNYMVNYRYMSDLVRCFEAMLRELQMRKTGDNGSTLAFDDLYSQVCPQLNDSQEHRMNRIFKELCVPRTQDQRNAWFVYRFAISHSPKYILDFVSLR